MSRTDRCDTDLALVSGAFAVTYLVACAASAMGAGGAPSWTDVAPFLALLGFAALVVRGGRERPGLLAVPWLLWPALYDGAVGVVLLRPDRFMDPLLARADAWLLGRAPGPPPWPLGGPVEELASLFYTSYYLVLPGGFAWLWWTRGAAAARRYTVGVLAALLGCAVVWVLFPAGGYHPTGSPTGEPFGPFTAAARWVYAANPHHAAAFPSSHVALAVAAAAGLVAHGGSRAWWVWAAGVAWSTVYGQYHYAVDAPPGVVVGLAAAAWARRGELGVGAWRPGWQRAGRDVQAGGPAAARKRGSTRSRAKASF